MPRTHIPCRICGNTHKNPASSSLCPDCGEKQLKYIKLLKESKESQNKKEQSDREIKEKAAIERKEFVTNALIKRSEATANTVEFVIEALISSNLDEETKCSLRYILNESYVD